MSVVAGTRKKCPVCKTSKLLKYEIRSRKSPGCIKCYKEGKVPVSEKNGKAVIDKPKASEKPHPADYQICEAHLYDGYYHVVRIGMKHTHCKRRVRPVPDSFPQGVVSLETLYSDDVACCEKCRELLARMFD